MPGLAFLLSACGLFGPVSPSPDPATSSLLLGGDISALTRIEQGGGRFVGGDRVSNAIAALRAHGSNTFRLRLFVAPDGSEVQVNDLAYTIALARRVKAAGRRSCSTSIAPTSGPIPVSRSLPRSLRPVAQGRTAPSRWEALHGVALIPAVGDGTVYDQGRGGSVRCRGWISSSVLPS